MLILEEAAYCDEGFFYETVAPILSIGSASLVAISTLTSEINFYTRLIKMKDPATDRPLFAVCAFRQKTNDFALLLLPISRCVLPAFLLNVTFRIVAPVVRDNLPAKSFARNSFLFFLFFFICFFLENKTFRIVAPAVRDTQFAISNLTLCLTDSVCGIGVREV